MDDALANAGQPPLSAWPYSLSLGTATEEPPAKAATAMWYRAQLIDVPLAHDGVEDPLEQALASSTVAVVVVEVTKEFESASSSGEIAVPPLNSPVGDYHAVLAVGAATNAETTVRRLLILNSWGDGWGAGGCGWLPLDYLIAFAVQASIVDPESLRASTSLADSLRTLGLDGRAMTSVVDPSACSGQKGV